MIERYEIGSSGRLQVELLNVGAAVKSIRVPGSRGDIDVIATGMRTQDFCDNPNYCGVTVGRYANRLANAHIRIDGVDHQLSANDATGRHCIHGGAGGLHLVEWEVDAKCDDALTFATTSADGDQGFPGQLQARVAYSIVDRDALRIEYRAVTDAPTAVNLTSHCYFNLAGRGGIGRHAVRIAADRFTPTDAEGIPFGQIRSVVGTPLDLRDFVELGNVLASDHPLISDFAGFDHNYVLDDRNALTDPVASVVAAGSGLRLEVYTSQPGLQLYTANHAVHPIARHGGLCLEAQNFPNAANQPGFPSALLRPGDEYRHFIEYRFSRHDGQP